MLTNEFQKEDGVQLGIGDGNWYLFFAKNSDFFKQHRMNEKRRLDGILWWRNFWRFVFIKDVHVYVRMRNNKRADQRRSRVEAIK